MKAVEAAALCRIEPSSCQSISELADDDRVENVQFPLSPQREMGASMMMRTVEPTMQLDGTVLSCSASQDSMYNIVEPSGDTYYGMVFVLNEFSCAASEVLLR